MFEFELMKLVKFSAFQKIQLFDKFLMNESNA